ncbi:MAG: GNAT family N-acetyltransferase [Devosia sp.]|uniref:GNAT family N-acetyltransferase n=1 Tax=Devosia sp. TaxID=1871048 RepID=UPI001ACB44F0|nr:GNAT family N-acetyltransferase [Devosia sp.]MBN9308837.1 GNAT family N-acetyltransferase [Devosia sp.]MBN9318056.1 GNAT family N-acetyltransferase [Devosia sp.]
MVPLSVSQIEGATLTAWPALKQAHDGLWLWRYARGYTKRANSIHCLDPSDGAYAELRLRQMAELSRAHGIPPVFRVTPLTAPEVVDVLDGLQWEEFEPSLVMAMEMPDEDFPVEFQARYFDPADPAWYRPLAQMAGHDQVTTDVVAQIVGAIACPVQGVLVYHKAGLPVAATLAAVSSGVGIFLNVVTHPSARGMGYGRAVMGAALNWGRSMGATHSALQVLASNVPALNLYASFGFGEVYSYIYRRAPDWGRG